MPYPWALLFGVLTLRTGTIVFGSATWGDHVGKSTGKVSADSLSEVLAYSPDWLPAICVRGFQIIPAPSSQDPVAHEPFQSGSQPRRSRDKSSPSDC